MRRALIGIVTALAVVLVGMQIFLPGIAEDRVEDRLTAGGGAAEAAISALPAARLLLGDGDRIEVRGSGLALDIEDSPRVFERLDGFGEVDLRLRDFHAGPFDVARFDLVREGGDAYRLVSSSTTSAGAVLEYSSETTGVPGGGLLRSLLGGAELTEAPLPVELDMELESDDGRVRVISGEGTIAGLPTGPLAELLIAAIAAQL